MTNIALCVSMQKVRCVIQTEGGTPHHHLYFPFIGKLIHINSIACVCSYGFVKPRCFDIKEH
ncbi:hypothetical protein CBL_08085 [Carabus blaptoides fortunei]